MPLPIPWTVDFLWKLSRHVSFRSALRLRDLAIRSKRGQTGADLVRVRVHHPFRATVWLREQGSDVGTFDEVIMRGIYQTLTQRAEGCRYVLDLGGNIGLTTLFLADRFPKCQVLTVEPSPDNQEILTRNLARLHAQGRCRICPGAVWGSDTTLNLSAVPAGIGFDAIQVVPRGSDDLDRPVPAHTVASLIQQAGFPHVDILKIDIEGSEVAVFRGPTDWLTLVNTIAIEFHGNSRQESGFDATVSAAGFVIEEDQAPNCVVAYRPPAQRVRANA